MRMFSLFPTHRSWLATTQPMVLEKFWHYRVANLRCCVSFRRASLFPLSSYCSLHDFIVCRILFICTGFESKWSNLRHAFSSSVGSQRTFCGEQNALAVTKNARRNCVENVPGARYWEYGEYQSNLLLFCTVQRVWKEWQTFYLVTNLQKKSVKRLANFYL